LTKKKKEKPKPFKLVKKFTNCIVENKEVDSYNTFSGFEEVGMLDPYDSAGSVQRALDKVGSY